MPRKSYHKYIRRETTPALLAMMEEIWCGNVSTLYLIHKYKVSKHIIYKLRHEMGLRKPQINSRRNKATYVAGYEGF